MSYKSPDIVSRRLYVQPLFLNGKRDFDEQSGIICKIPFIKAFDRIFKGGPKKVVLPLSEHGDIVDDGFIGNQHRS